MALNAISTRSGPAASSAAASAFAIGGRNFEPFVPWTQCAGNGPPSPVNETWSIGW